jgi:hypothetical protein
MTESSTPAKKPRSVLFVGLAACVVAAGVGVWVLTARGDDPEAVVVSFENAVEHDDLDAAHALVDYRYRLEEVLGDFWRSGTDADRDALVRLTQGMLTDTTGKHWPDCCRGRAMARRLMSAEADVAWVESRPEGEGALDFKWRYRLNRRDGAWRITQREYTRERAPSDSTRFWSMALKAVRQRLGKEPTLNEFQANLLAVMPELRVRTYVVPSAAELKRLQQQQKSQPAADAAP